jgi:HNH endonuclease
VLAFIYLGQRCRDYQAAQTKAAFANHERQTEGQTMTDQERFINVANSFKQKLNIYGLTPVVNLQIKDEASTNGLWAKVATWSSERPIISVWLDETRGRGHRVFWFGFQSDAKSISSLEKEVSSIFSKNIIQIKTTDWTETEKTNRCWLKKEKVNEVKSNGNLAYEKYPQAWDKNRSYFGISADGLKFSTNEELATRAATFIGKIIQYVDPSRIKRHEEKEIRGSTEHDQLIKARDGHGRFRTGLFARWDGGCAVTGCTVKEVLRASHIKPWKKCIGKSGNHERLDPNNGLLLTATLDALFNEGLISFDDNSNMLVSTKLQKEQRPYVLPKGRLKLLKELSREQKQYLKFHREKEYEGN